MNFITPLLFVFYLQVMPPPPTMHGGGDLQSGYSVNDNSPGFPSRGGNIFTVENYWSTGALRTALAGGTPLPGGWVGYDNILLGLQNGSLIGIEGRIFIFFTFDDWNALIDYAAANDRDVKIPCNLAEQNGSAAKLTNPNCIAAFPLPKELLFLSTLSFFLIHCYQSREEFSKLTLFKKSSE